MPRGMETQMSDEHEEGGEPTPTPTPAPTPTPKPQPSADDIESMSEDELREHLRKARKSLKTTNAENARYRQERAQREQEQEEQERLAEQSKPEVEQLRKKTAEYERRIREAEEKAARVQQELLEQRRDREVEEEAVRQGAEPKQTALMLRGSRDHGIEYDPDSDRHIGVKEAVKKLITRFPVLTEQGGMQRGRGTPVRRDEREAPRSPRDVSQYDDVSSDLNRHIVYSGL